MGASNSSSMGCSKRIGLDLIHNSRISSSERLTIVPGGLPLKPRSFSFMSMMDCMGSSGVVGRGSGGMVRTTLATGGFSPSSSFIFGKIEKQFT